MRVAVEITLSAEDRLRLMEWIEGAQSARLAQRARIILGAADGRRNNEIAADLGCTRRTVGMWRRRFLIGGLASIEQDAIRPVRKRVIGSEMVDRILRKTTQEGPPDGAHWSTRSMARAVGVSQKTVSRIWQAYGLNHRTNGGGELNLSARNPSIDTVALCVSPPENSLIISVNRPNIHSGANGEVNGNGHAKPESLSASDCGVLITHGSEHRREEEWIDLLTRIDRDADPNRDFYIFADSFVNRQRPNLIRWLAQHPRFHVHLAPASSSCFRIFGQWLCVFADRQSTRSILRLLSDLDAATADYLDRQRRKDDDRVSDRIEASEAIVRIYQCAKRALNKLAL